MKPRMKTKWGHWNFRQETYELLYIDDSGAMLYPVDLEYCEDSANTLDWIAQVLEKSWTSKADVGDLVEALNDLIGLQQNICGGGVDHHIDPAKVIERRIGR